LAEYSILKFTEGENMQIPTMIVNEGTVLDVTFTTWENLKDNTKWEITEETQLPDSVKNATHIVFELPIGCYMVDVTNYEFGEIFTLGKSRRRRTDMDAVPCTIPRRIQQEMIADTAEETTVHSLVS